MALRLLLGLLKGLALGGLAGFALAKAGMAAPSALIAYPIAALVSALVGLIAGKPVWAAEAKIEVGLKAGFGAVLGLLFMFLARKFLTFGVPIDLGSLAQANQSLGETTAAGTFGGLAITSLPMVAGLLGAFYDADNTPSSDADASTDGGAASKNATKSSTAQPKQGARVAKSSKVLSSPSLEEELALDDEEQRKKTSRK